jgi:fumarate reductase subunit C
MSAKLFIAQRLTAFVLAMAVAVHLGTILYTVRGGLTAAEILARTHGNIGFALFYAVFVVAVAIHAPIGLRVLAVEFFDFREKTLVPWSACVAAVFAVGLLFILNLG